MSLRIRETGEVVCAAMHPELPGDVYLDDAQHYAISVVCRALKAVAYGRWRFVEHGTRDLSANEDDHMLLPTASEYE
jgi:hypothetical protein